MKLLHPPIIEAIVDIDCDMRPKFDLTQMEGKAGDPFRDRYPTSKKRYLEEFRFEKKGDQPTDYSTTRNIQSIMFIQEGGKQLVQVRAQGFSFNRLAPYSSLDDYLPEIERAWKIFVKIASPLRVRTIRLHFINRILLPAETGNVNLVEYLKIYPLMPTDNLTLNSFLNQYSATENVSGNKVDVILVGQPFENQRAPVILDISTSRTVDGGVEDWSWLLDNIVLLRGLKNRVFENTLTERCLNLFQQP